MCINEDIPSRTLCEYVDIRHTLNGNVVSVVPATRWRPACLNT